MTKDIIYGLNFVIICNTIPALICRENHQVVQSFMRHLHASNKTPDQMKNL